MTCAGYMNILTVYGDSLRLPDARGRSFMKDKLCEAPRVIRKYKSKRSAVMRDSRERSARVCEEISVGRSVVSSSSLFPSLLADMKRRVPASVALKSNSECLLAHRKALPAIPSTSPQLQRKGKSRGIWFAFFSLFPSFLFLLPATIDDRRARRAVRYLIYRTAPASCKLVTARSRDLVGK